MIQINKKGQVTVFIVLGLIVLLSVLTFIYFKLAFSARYQPVPTSEPSPVSRYVEECIQKNAEGAISILGRQGGYIYIPTIVASNPSQILNPDNMGIIIMPFWFYKGTKYAPSVYSVQNDISRYVEERLPACINNFDIFKEQYKIEPLEQMKVAATLNKDDVSVFLNYRIKVSYWANNTVVYIDKFSASVPVKLKKILEIANKILDSEVRTAFLENFTIDLMTSNPRIPFTDMVFTCKQEEWKLSDIKREVEDMLLINLPRIRIKNTDYRPFLEDESKYKKLLTYHIDDIARGRFPKDVPEDAYEYLHMFYDIGTQKDDTISVAFSLPQEGIEIVGRPNENGILKSRFAEGQKKFIQFFCVNIWHFVYDVNFPVVVSMRDDTSFNGNGFVFSWVMPVTIHNNEPFKKKYGKEFFTSSTFDRGFCDQRTGGITEIHAYGKEDGLSNIELDKVNLSIECFKYFCPLGQTTADEGRYRLRTVLPNCANPFIVAEKEGYLKARKQLDNAERFDIDLIRLKKMNFGVVVNRYNSFANLIEGSGPLGEDMNVSLRLSTELGDGFTQFKAYPIDNMTDESLRAVTLIDSDASYSLEIVLTDSGEYIGGYSGQWNVSAVDVSGSNKVIFHAVQYVPTPFSEQEKLKMVQYILKGSYLQKLKPELVRE